MPVENRLGKFSSKESMCVSLNHLMSLPSNKKMPVMSEESRESNDSSDDEMNRSVLGSSGYNEVHTA